MIWFVGCSVIFIGYIAAYWRRGINHPILVFQSYSIVMFPLKYFLVKASGIDWSGSDFLGGFPMPEEVDVDIAGMYLFFFWLAATLFHVAFSYSKIKITIIETIPRIDFVSPTLLLAALIVVSFIAISGVGALSNSNNFREFTSKGFGAYPTALLEPFYVFALIQAIAQKRPLRTSVVLAVIIGLCLLSGRSGVLAQLLYIAMIYLAMVERIVPIKSIVATLAIAPTAMLAQGLMRARGGWSLAGIDFIRRQLDGDTILIFIANQFAARVNQLESFSMFATRYHLGQFNSDPWEPFYIFAGLGPRTLWPEKPLMFSPLMTKLTAPQVHDAGTVFNFFAPAELMYCYGMSGLFVTAALYGFIFYVLDAYFLAAHRRPYVFLFVSVTFFNFICATSQSAVVNGPGILMLLLDLGLIALFCRVRVLPKSSEH